MKQYLLLLALIIVSCSSSEDKNVCIDDACIDGEWRWLESSGSIAGITINPQTEMLSRKLVIDETKYTEIVNNNIVLETEYEYVKSGELSGFNRDSLVLKLTTGNWYVVYLENDTLELIEPCFDCWSHRYVQE